VRGDLTIRADLGRCLDGVDAVFLVWTAPAVAASAAVEQCTQRLVAEGISFVDAEKLIALVPLAFGRVLISHMGQARFSHSF